ncbi:MAG TPA: ABC transporter substrate-binding protein [Candidatus Gallacutalibacter pullicola]|uniref:ABC transporter substrate-binding protein n=1 Tax=Candidatus Gallacutalibacter pullicola TaxID=2840830 RepID=A0A9D1J0D0_9FIRM|nr:ABC transporter substrate-binding protein [Candidatus Gallacutalibacter pullicola]
MNKVKRFLGMALAALMVVSSAAGCSSDTASSESTGEPTFKIGSIGPATGNNAAYGLAVQNGAQIAVDEINAAGGINGYQIEFSFEDDESDAEKAVNAYNVLKDWGMQMLLGTVTSAPCTAVASETDNDRMFQITPSGTAVESVQGHDNVFRVCFSDPAQGAKSAEYIATKGLATKIAVIYDSSDVYSSGIYSAFAAEAENQGLEIVAAEAFTADNKTDFSVQLQKAKDSGAELVFLPIYYQEASAILQQADNMGYKPMYFGCDGLDGLLGVSGFDTSLAEGVMLLTPFSADAQDDKTQAFNAAYEEAYGETPIQFAADAYDGIYAIKLAAEQAGITPDMDYTEICEKMIEAMPQIELDGLTGIGGITWGEDGEPNKDPKGVIIENGAYVSMD